MIWDILEDTAELADQTKNEIEISRKEFKQGKYKTLEQLKKEIGM